MSSQRPERVQEAIRQEISNILHREVKDERLGFLTVTRVDLTKDLRYAKIYFSVLGERKDKFLALKGLNSAKGYIKGLLADRLKLRFMPEIDFRVDDTLEKTQEIFSLLEKLKRERKDEERSTGDTQS